MFLRTVMDAGSLVIVSRMMLTIAMVWMKMIVKVKVMMKVIKIDVSIPTSTRWR